MTEHPTPPILSREQYKADLKALRSRDPARIKGLLDRHFLKVFLGRSYDRVIGESVLKVLKRKANEGDIDAITLDRIVREGLLHVEHIKRDKLSGLHIYDRGMLVEADHYLPGQGDDNPEHLARTIYSIFHDQSARERAGQAQQFFHELAGYAREHANTNAVRITLRQLRTMEPTYNAGTIVGNLFLGNARDLQETFKDCDLDERVSHLRTLDRMDIILGHYAHEFLQTARGKALATARNGKAEALFKPVDHRRLLYEKVLLRADPTLKNRSDEEWKDLADLLAIDPADTPLRQTVVHGDALPANTMVQAVRDAYHAFYYTPIDFEFACVDYVEKMLVQRWAKSGIYDHLGRPLHVEKGDVQQLLVEAVLKTYQARGLTLDRTTFEQLIGKLKIENYLQWASRSKKYAEDLKDDLKASDGDIKKQEDLTKYFHTLAVLEIKRQGLISEDTASSKDAMSSDHRIAYLAGLFGETFPDEEIEEEMLRIHENLHPDRSGHSVMKEGYQGNVDKQLERIVAQASRKRAVGIGKTVGTSLAIAGMVVGLGAHAHNLEYLRYLTEVDSWIRETYKQRAETLAWTLKYDGIHDEDMKKAEYREAILTPKQARAMAERAGIQYNLVWKVLNAVKWVSELGLKNEEREALRGYPLCDVYDSLEAHQTKPIEGRYDSRGERYLATGNYERCLQKLRTILEVHHIDPKDPFSGARYTKTVGGPNFSMPVVTEDSSDKPLEHALAEFFRPTGLEQDDLSAHDYSRGTSFPLLRWFGRPDWREKPAEIVGQMISSIVRKRVDSFDIRDEYMNAWDAKLEAIEEKARQVQEQRRNRQEPFTNHRQQPAHQYQRR